MAAALLMTLCSIAHASPAADINNGFLTGKSFQSGSQSMRTAYVIGVLDGFSYAPVFGAPDTKIEKLRQCIGAMHADARQVGTIVDKYLEANPDSLSLQMQPIVLRAMRQVCATHGMTVD
jgi:hypothetical protein